MDDNLHSPQRRLIELRMEHADLDSLIDRLADEHPLDDLVVRRLKKRRLLLRDQIAQLAAQVDPPGPALVTAPRSLRSRPPRGARATWGGPARPGLRAPAH